MEVWRIKNVGENVHQDM